MIMLWRRGVIDLPMRRYENTTCSACLPGAVGRNRSRDFSWSRLRSGRNRRELSSRARRGIRFGSANEKQIPRCVRDDRAPELPVHARSRVRSRRAMEFEAVEQNLLTPMDFRSFVHDNAREFFGTEFFAGTAVA